MNDIEAYDGALWPEWVLVGDVTYPPGGVLGPRIQYSLELVLIHSGEMTVWVDDVAHYAPALTVSLLFPGHEERFAFSIDSETHHSFAHIGLPYLPAEMYQRLRGLPRMLPLSSAMNDLMQRALALRTATLSTARPLQKAAVAQMLWRYIGEGERAANGGDTLPTHPALEQACQYIQTHLHQPLTLDMLADAAAASPSHLIRLFRSEMHTTPIAYLWQQRIAQGIEMLENTGLPVGIIAERCGFQTSYHFSRRVRQATGRAPSEVRRQAWGRR